jgi:hypothetical protein
MEFGKPFSYVFEDPDWLKKVVIMGLIMLIPIVGQLVAAGWMIDIMKKMINHEPLTLPNVDFGGQLGRGFGSAVIGLVYALPILVVVIIQVIIIGVIGGFNADQSYDLSSTTGVVISVISLCFTLVYIVYGIAISFLLPIAYGRYAEFGKMGAALKFGEVFGLAKKVIVPLIIVILGTMVAGIVASLGTIGCGVGVVVTAAYAMAITGHFYGQVYNLAKATA